ncbi:YkvA family protein [Adhaeribacter terreus]|uniref:YkvA family protein n=1 Tax=Adhaeribacter terreus TaxID=529703 RepID=A0ABW0EA15_9BACT
MENHANQQQGKTVASTPLFKGILNRAEGYLKQPIRIKQLLNDAYKKASEKKDFGTIAHEVWENLQMLGRMIKASVAGDYHGVPTSTLVGGVAVFLYFLTPIDFVPDFIPVVGLLDDVSLLAWFMTSIKEEINKFADWEAAGSISHNVSGSGKALAATATGSEAETKTATKKKTETKSAEAEVKHIPAKKNPIEEHPTEEHATKRAAASGSGEPNVRASTTDSTRIPSKNHDDSTAGGNVR